MGMISVMDAPSAQPEPRLFFDLMFELGKAAVGLTPEERKLSAQLVALVLEYLLVGGEVFSETLFDNFEPHVGIRTSTAVHGGGDREGWFLKLQRPVHQLLAHLVTRDVL